MYFPFIPKNCGMSENSLHKQNDMFWLSKCFFQMHGVILFYNPFFCL